MSGHPLGSRWKPRWGPGARVNAGIMDAGGGPLPPIKNRGLNSAAHSARGPRGSAAGSGPAGVTNNGWGTLDDPSSVSHGSGRGAQRPPWQLIAVGALIVPSTLLIGPITRVGAMVLGMFVGILALGFTRLEINRRVSSGRYADWNISASTVASAVFVAGWFSGFVSLWRIAIDVSRRFT